LPRALFANQFRFLVCTWTSVEAIVLICIVTVDNSIPVRVRQNFACDKNRGRLRTAQLSVNSSLAAPSLWWWRLVLWRRQTGVWQINPHSVTQAHSDTDEIILTSMNVGWMTHLRG